MKRFVPLYQSFFLGKKPLVLVALILLCSIVSGSFILHSLNPVRMVGTCSATTVQYNASNAVQSCTKYTSHKHVQELISSKSNPNLQSKGIGPELLSIPRQVAPTPPPTPMAQPVKLSPTAVPTPIPTIPIPASPGQAAVIAMITQIFGPNAPEALHVARCESGFNPSAYNPISIGGSHAAGVFQILYPSTWNSTSEASNSPYSAMANVLAAHQIFVRDGYNWHEWSCA